MRLRENTIKPPRKSGWPVPRNSIAQTLCNVQRREFAKRKTSTAAITPAGQQQPNPAPPLCKSLRQKAVEQPNYLQSERLAH